MVIIQGLFCARGDLGGKARTKKAATKNVEFGGQCEVKLDVSFGDSFQVQEMFT